MLKRVAKANVFGAEVVVNDLMLDMCVLVSGSGLSDNVYKKQCTDLMKKMINIENYFLALDDRGKVLNQYYTNLKHGVFGYHFIQQMLSREKTVKIPWQDLNQNVRVKLEEQGFTRNDEDYKFVVVASGTCCRKLVSHEPHFFNVKRILKKIPVYILWPFEA